MTHKSCSTLGHHIKLYKEFRRGKKQKKYKREKVSHLLVQIRRQIDQFPSRYYRDYRLHYLLGNECILSRCTWRRRTSISITEFYQIWFKETGVPGHFKGWLSNLLIGLFVFLFWKMLYGFPNYYAVDSVVKIGNCIIIVHIIQILKTLILLECINFVDIRGRGRLVKCQKIVRACRFALASSAKSFPLFCISNLLNWFCPQYFADFIEFSNTLW